MLLATDRRPVHAAARAAGTGFTHSFRSNDPKVSARRANVLAETAGRAYAVEALEGRVLFALMVEPHYAMDIFRDSQLPGNDPTNGVLPPDPAIAVGPGAVVLTANSDIQVFNKERRPGPLL